MIDVESLIVKACAVMGGMALVLSIAAIESRDWPSASFLVHLACLAFAMMRAGLLIEQDRRTAGKPLAISSRQSVSHS